MFFTTLKGMAFKSLTITNKGNEKMMTLKRANMLCKFVQAHGFEAELVGDRIYMVESDDRGEVVAVGFATTLEEAKQWLGY